MTDRLEAQLVEEALRVNQRFIEEVVEAYNLCPYSRPARGAGAVSRAVYPAPLAVGGEPPAAVLSWLTEQERAGVEIALWICPRASHGPRAWRRFAEDVRLAWHAARGARAVWACAAFHPELPYGTHNPTAALSLFRRSPDPTVQFVRLSALEGLTAADAEVLHVGMLAALLRPGSVAAGRRESPSERVTRMNYALLDRIGAPELEARCAAIRADRDASYARLGVPA